MKRICDYTIFDNYLNKTYTVITDHKIFGKSRMDVAVSGFIDDEQRAGISVHGNGLYCYKNDSKFQIVENKGKLIISDSLLKISVSF